MRLLDLREDALTASRKSPLESRLVWLFACFGNRGGDRGVVLGGLELTTFPITIYLSDGSAHEQVEAAVEQFLTAAGGHIEHRHDPVLGLWFRRMRARITGRVVHSPLAGKRLSWQRMLRNHVSSWLKMPLSPQPCYRTSDRFLAALQSTKDAVIRAGALLIVKVDFTQHSE